MQYLKSRGQGQRGEGGPAELTTPALKRGRGVVVGVGGGGGTARAVDY